MCLERGNSSVLRWDGCQSPGRGWRDQFQGPAGRSPGTVPELDWGGFLFVSHKVMAFWNQQCPQADGPELPSHTHPRLSTSGLCRQVLVARPSTRGASLRLERGVIAFMSIVCAVGSRGKLALRSPSPPQLPLGASLSPNRADVRSPRAEDTEAVETLCDQQGQIQGRGPGPGQPHRAPRMEGPCTGLNAPLLP